MAKSRDTGFKNVTCNKCNAEAHSSPGKQHRRCSGNPDAQLRGKRDKLPGKERGIWG